MFLEEKPPTIPDHELLKCVGSGSYGTVWLGRSIMGTFRAVKIIRRQSFAQQRPYDREFAGIMKFEPLSRSHPGLVSVLHIGCNRTDNFFYYIMEVADDVESGQEIDPERYEPRTLRSSLEKLDAHPPAECVRVGLALSSAVAHLHAAGLVHRDLKPSNVIFVNNTPKLADIGLVTDIGESLTFVGSEGYVPPEGPGKPTADIYGLGKVLYELVTGLEQNRYPHLPANFDRLPEPALRHKVFEVIRKACEINHLRRYQTGREMYESLLQLMPGSGAGAAVRLDSQGPAAARGSAALKVVIAGQPSPGPARAFVATVRSELEKARHKVFVDEGGSITVEWAQAIEKELNAADVVIVALTEESVESEVLGYEVQMAQAQAAQRGGRPRLVPVRLQCSAPLAEPLASLVGSSDRIRWNGPADDAKVLGEILSAIDVPAVAPPAAVAERVQLESVGGAVPLESRFYLAREADEVFQTAIAQGESIVLVKGARQMGKTSLLARGLHQARQVGFKVIHTDFQKLNAACFESLDNFYFELATLLADQLDLDTLPEDVWESRRSPNANFERFVKREVLTAVPQRIVWGMDEIDRLLVAPFSSEVFALFRSWHNTRALDPTVLWSKLTLAMAYATEAHLFISDLVQSPFNVGVRVTLEDFRHDQVATLNSRYGEPLADRQQLDRFHRLLGGQPYLVRRAFNELAGKNLTLDQLEAQASNDQGLFADHLGRIVMLLAKDPALLETARRVVRGQVIEDNAAFHRLRGGGVLVGSSVADARPRCQLYATYLERHMK